MATDTLHAPHPRPAKSAPRTGRPRAASVLAGAAGLGTAHAGMLRSLYDAVAREPR